MYDHAGYESPNEVQEDLAQTLDLQRLTAYDGERVARHEITAMLDMTRCPRCGLWQHQWNVSARGHCSTCAETSV